MIFKQMFSGGGEFTLNITSNVANPDIPTLASAAGWNGTGFLKVNITAPYVNRLLFLNTWSFPSGIEVEISASTLVGGIRGDVGSGGGSALLAQIPVSIRNSGVIAGAGGSGGTGQSTFVSYNSTQVNSAGSGGGRGQGFALVSSTTPIGAEPGSAGAYNEYSGPVFGGDTRPWAQGGTGGGGGTWGQPGGVGAFGSIGGSYTSGGQLVAPTNGLASGNSVSGNSFITWLATGTRLGPIA